MTDHDDLCPWPDPTGDPAICAYCELIVAARRDERERVAEKGAALMDTNEHLIRADERERIAREIERSRDEAMDHYEKTGEPTFATAIISYQSAARIARQVPGGNRGGS